MSEPDTSVQNESTLEDLLDESTVGAYLVSRGLLPDATANVTKLAGGVSNVVLAAERSGQRFLVKQSLARLAVADEWFAPTDRVITEAETMELLAGITPDNVPAVYDQDAERHAITLQVAPADWADWKTYLMAGQVQPAVAGALGGILANWHRETLLAADFSQRLEDHAAFELLRVDPYYRTVASRAPDVAETMNALIERMASRRMCLVHGDFSPKNILLAPHSAQTSGPEDQADVTLWVIDFEAAHRGDPAFDVAFMCTHLLLKSLALPSASHAFDNCLRAFAAAYSARVTSGEASGEAASGGVSQLGPLQPDWAYISQHIGALLLARVKGKSPVGYLDASAEQAAWRLGVRLLGTRLSTIEELFIRRNESRS